jgi:hypothetical protein
MASHRSRLLRGLLVLVSLQVGCHTSAPPDPTVELLRQQEVMRQSDASRTRELLEGFCVALGESAANQAALRGDMTLEEMLRHTGASDPQVAQHPLQQIMTNATIYVYAHPEKTAEQLQRELTQQCREASRGALQTVP